MRTRDRQYCKRDVQNEFAVMEFFAEETGVYGLSLQRPHVPRSERIFWAIITIVFSALTVNDLYGLFDTFSSEPTLTAVTITTNSSVYFDPPPMVSFEM